MQRREVVGVPYVCHSACHCSLRSSSSLWAERGGLATSRQLAALVLLFLCAVWLLSPRVASAQPANFPKTLSISTAATFVDSVVPSSASNSFEVTLLETNPTEEGDYTFRACTISGEPADDAVRVGRCQWTEFEDKGYNLLYFKFNWQDEEDVGTDAVWGEFCLLNEFGAGNWVRFYTADGTSESVVGSASGPLTYPGGKTEPPTDVFNVAGTWVVGLSLISGRDCNFIDLPPMVQGTFQFTQQDDMFFGEEQGAISELLSGYIEGALTVSGLVEPNGDFELFSEKGSAELLGCTITVFAECEGNFREESLECMLPVELSGSCPAVPSACEEIEYHGTITKTNTSSGA